ncbi:MAG: metal-dependent hydrolase [Bacteroidota bacterium]|nr:metal-dependent hydrolase [Bacteroidota bacterium]MDP3147301.1 metal-dependent hydrolase [Bacteroidota bacterium]MDP3557325.1 metal-dependent hydrolase [Bacteroidota bacterium]
MNITYYGHSCFGVEINGKHLLFDPFITPNELANFIDVDLVRADYILISHGHEDHIADAESIAKRTGAKVLCCPEIAAWLEKKGVENIRPMNIGGKIKFDFGSIKCVVAQHSSSLPDGSYGGNPMGFVIESSEKNFYYAGDTALTYDMKLIGDYRNIDFAFLPIGNNYTMGVDNAIIACDFIKCNQIIGMHYDTFGHIMIDQDEAVSKFENSGKALTLFEIGSTRKI